MSAQEAGVALKPFTAQGQAVAPTDISAGGANLTVWETSKEQPNLLFRSAASSPPIPPSGSAAGSYLKVTYLDRGYGRLSVTYKSGNGKWSKPDKFTSLALMDTGKLVTSYERCPGLTTGSPEVKIGLDKADGRPLAVSEVVLQSTAFPDKHFQFILADAWNRLYDGPTLPQIDNRTLKGKVMVGYQGWFRTPNDPYNGGWTHWGNIPAHTFGVDMWPNPADYPAEVLEKAADVKTVSGKTAYLFSSAWPEVARVHFAWMRKYGIDGAFVQRFLAKTANVYSLGGASEWVLGSVREAANREGRIWAIEYDVGGCPDDKVVEYIKNDWTWLVDQFGLRSDPSYAHEGGKPVVFVWGMSIASRHLSVQSANAVVDFLKNDPKYGGNYVIGGLAGNWRAYDAAWQENIARHDCLLSWHSTDYAGDQQAFAKMGASYYPMVWPGFSWANLKHLSPLLPEGFIAREGGQYYERLISKANEAGAERLFVGMFDEYDEGTAIMPMSDDPPATSRQPGTSVKFFNNEAFEGIPGSRNVPRIDLTLDNTPPEKGVPGTHLSFRYDGEILPPVTGQYTFYVRGPVGDYVHVVLGDKRLDVGRLPGVNDPKIVIHLNSGQPVAYKLESKHRAEPGRLQLCWDRPGGAGIEPVPDSAYLDEWGRFVTNEGSPPDLWLKLTGEWKHRRADNGNAPRAKRGAPASD